MIDFRLSIPRYDWRVSFHCALSCYHIPQILLELEKLDCPYFIIDKAEKLMETCKLNIGLTFSNQKKRESVVVVALTSSAAEFLNSLQHEIRHLVDDIARTNGIRDKEELGYLTGNINRDVFPYIHKLLCDECRLG